MEKYQDWSPASVFGSTAFDTRSSAAKHGDLNSREMSHKPSRMVRERSGNEDRHMRLKSANLIGSSLDRNTKDLATCGKSQRQIEESNEQKRHTWNERVLLLPNQVKRKSHHDNNERDFATRIIQQYVRVFLLRNRERERVHEVETLRQLLEATAVTVLQQHWRRCRQRRKISRYMHELRIFESRLQLLLAKAVNVKSEKERQLQIHKHQQQLHRQQERKQQASMFLCDWYHGRRAIRQFRQRQIHLRTEQRKLICRSQWMLIQQQIVLRQKHKFELQQKAAEVITYNIKRWKLRRTMAERRKRMKQSAVRIASFYQRQVRVCQQKKYREGAAKVSHCIVNKYLRIAFNRWEQFMVGLRTQEQQQQNAAACVLQRLFRVFVAASVLLLRRKAATLIQTCLRGVQARKHVHLLRKKALENKRYTAAIIIQKHVRGLVVRRSFAKLLKKMRDRFRCSNCGVIEPSGAYCKLCGRRRTNFEPLKLVPCPPERKITSKRPFNSNESLSLMKMSISLPPVQPVPPSGIPTRSNRNISRRMSSPFSREQLENDEEERRYTESIGPLNALPAVLSPRSSRKIMIEKKSGASPLRHSGHYPFNNSKSIRKMGIVDATKLRALELNQLHMSNQRPLNAIAVNNRSPALAMNFHQGSAVAAQRSR